MKTIITDNGIYGFFDEYEFLSNFYSCPNGVMLENIVYPTSEHAYMSAKSYNRDYKQKILSCGEAKNAKKLGRAVRLRIDWEDVKLQVMYEVVFSKFLRNRDIQLKLLDTGNKELFEMNWWGDRYWGIDAEMNGENNLGKTLMNVRTNIRSL